MGKIYSNGRDYLIRFTSAPFSTILYFLIREMEGRAQRSACAYERSYVSIIRQEVRFDSWSSDSGDSRVQKLRTINFHLNTRYDFIVWHHQEAKHLRIRMFACQITTKSLHETEPMNILWM